MLMFAGERTLTVCTKLDLMSTSTNLHEHLSRKGAIFSYPYIEINKIILQSCRHS